MTVGGRGEEDKENADGEEEGKEKGGGSARLGHPNEEHENEARERKRRKMVAQGRFGARGHADDGRGIERFQVRLEEPFTLGGEAAEGSTPAEREPEAERPAARRRGRKRKSDFAVLDDGARDAAAPGDNAGVSSWAPKVEVTFHGSHVFAGIRSLVEAGAIDGERMPAWMTGEDGVSVGVVKGRRIIGHKGSGT